MEITLEQVDKVIERTGVSYAVAKRALETTNGNVLDAIILIEEELGCELKSEKKPEENKAETIEELKTWFKDLINKGNVSRIRVLKDDKEVVDVPVNAGIAAGVIAIIIPPILAFAVVAAVVTQITIEITKADGTVEVVNKYVTKAVNETKTKANSFAEKMKEKMGSVNFDKFRKNSTSNKEDEVSETVFSYTVNFDEEEM